MVFCITEEHEKPADLSQRIVFKSKNPEKQVAITGETKSEKKNKKQSSRPDISKSKLSFQVDDDEDENSSE